VVVECAWLAFLAALPGGAFAWWAAPWIVEMTGTPDNPTRLILPADWRVLGFGLAMALAVTVFFGLPAALRASGVRPASALRGGEPRMRTRMMRLLIAGQVAFCVLVLFVAGLLVTTSNRLAQQQTGFSAERLLTLETVTAQAQPGAVWEQVAGRLRAEAGVEAVALCEWPLLTGGSWNGFLSIHGAPPGPVASYFLSVSPEWREVMKIPLLHGRDFRASDSVPGTALVNESFARHFFGTERPDGEAFDVVSAEGRRTRYQVVGVVGDARYKDMREPIQPTAYFPFQAKYSRATFLVRTSSRNPVAMASALRLDVPRAKAGFRVSNTLTQAALIERHTVRERLLALLALFFGVVAVLLAGVGLYGVLDYSVLQRRREIGIRIAVGAQSGDIARRVLADVFTVVTAGALLGIALGLASVRLIEAQLYQVKATDLEILTVPAVTIFAVALVAAVPAVIRAVRTDPAMTLRAE
jgi:predicted permease